jgi:putative salt-induced outer membrane protein YdiY
VNKLIRAAAIAALVAAGSASFADTILFKNGDKISGEILDMQDGKIRIKSAVAGEILVDTVDVATFSTDGLIDLQLVDGTTIKQRVEAANEGNVAIAGEAGAQEVPLASLRMINPRTEWKGSVVAGAMFNRGNTDTDAANVWFDITRRAPMDRYFLGGQYNWGRQEDEDGDKLTTIENWTVVGKYDHFFNEKLYGYASLRADHDRIAELQYRLIPSVGLGYQWAEGPEWNFFTEAGLAYVYEKYEDPEVPVPDFDDDDSNMSLRLAYHYDRKINDKVSVFHNLEFFPSIQDLSEFFLVTDLGVRAMLTQRFFIEGKIELRHDSEPAEDALKTDQRYVIGLGWTF